MNSQQNKEVVLRYVAAFNQGNLDAVCACFIPDALIYGVLGWGEVAKARPIWELLMKSFQINLHIESMIAEGDIVAVRFTERGKFVAPFRGTEPTGKSYEVVAMEWFQFSNGGISRRWGARDSASIFRQMGIPVS